MSNDAQYVAEIFSKLQPGNRSVYLEVTKLVVELCTIARSLQQPNRITFYKVMSNHGIFGKLEEMLVRTNPIPDLVTQE